MFLAILKTKEREAEEGFSDVLEQGWLIKEGPNESRRKRFVGLLYDYANILLLIAFKQFNRREFFAVTLACSFSHPASFCPAV